MIRGPMSPVRHPRPPRRPRPSRAAAALLCVLGAAGAVLGAAAPDPARGIPAIVFVSRDPLGDASGVPGVGPSARAAVTRGRLLLRSASGAVRDLVPARRFVDVADPAVSWDGTRVAFAAVEHPDSAWRIWTVGVHGRDLRAVTRTDRALDLSAWGEAGAAFARYDDLDPAWLPDGRLVFASTRFPMRAPRITMHSSSWLCSST